MSFDLNKAIDWDKVGISEGKAILQGYVVGSLRNYTGTQAYDVINPVRGNGGVTIATGFDIGVKSKGELEALEISKELKEKLKPFADTTGQSAVALLFARKGLEITSDEAKSLDLAGPKKILKTVSEQFDAVRGSGTAFFCLPKGIRTAIFSYAYQNGQYPNSYKGPLQVKFWKAITSGKYDEAIEVLRSYTQYTERRQEEAELISEDKNKPPQAPDIEGRCAAT